MVARPFLKWVGGKRKLVEKLKDSMSRPMRRYHEPFVGGGALFFSLASERRREEPWAVLTDMNERLVRTYKGIRDELEGVLERLEAHAEQHCDTHYYATRGRDIDAASSDAEVAAWMIYLNKTGFNGLYRVNRKGGFNVPIGRYDNPTILDEANLRACHEVLQHTHIRHQCYRNVFHEAEEGDVVYFDPPYVPLNKTSNFTSYTKGGFGPQDQVDLRDMAWELKRRGVNVILSNHDTPEVRELYKEFDIQQVMMSRSINSRASKRGAVAEVIIS